MLPFIIAQVVLFAGLQLITPESRLSFIAWELLLIAPLFVALAYAKVRKEYHKYLGTFIALNALFVVAHYQIHEGTLSLVSFFAVIGPGFIWGALSVLKSGWFHLKQADSRKALAWSSLSWGLFAFAVPPLPLGPIAVLLLVPWMRVLLTENMGRALFATFWSGVLFNSASYYWIFNVAKVGPPPAIISGLFLLVSYMSMFHVIAAWIFVKVRDKKIGKLPMIWIAPLGWAGIEVLRSYGEISFPWGHLGYVLGNHAELLQGLAYVGVYGYTLFILYANLIATKALHSSKPKLFALPIFALVFLWIAGSISIKSADLQELKNPSESMRIALVQPSITQTNKWSKQYFDSVMTKTWNLVETIETKGLDLIVLPETAIPDLLPLRNQEDQRLRRFALDHKVQILIGSLNYDRHAEPPKKYNYYNSAFFYDTLGGRTEYRKIRLVPFSEHLPFDGLLPVVNYVDLGEGDFSPGTDLPKYGKEQWTPNICYETIYPDFLRGMVNSGTRILINITNDGWFGKTTAPGQHANLVKYRAVETGLPIARVANSGISVFYDAQGRSFEKTELYEEKVVYHRLALRSLQTIYAKIGDVFELLLVISFALLSLYAFILSPKKE